MEKGFADDVHGLHSEAGHKVNIGRHETLALYIHCITDV